MDLREFELGTENASVCFKKSTLERIRKFMKKNKIAKFSPFIDKLVSDWLDSQEMEADK